jgi:hypothetical protein
VADSGEYRQAAGAVRSKINYATACAFRFLRQPSRPIGKSSLNMATAAALSWMDEVPVEAHIAY